MFPSNASQIRFLLVVLIAAQHWVGGCRTGDASPLAIHDEHENVVGRYVGGGLHFGKPRDRRQGIWARDYAGLDSCHLVELRWSGCDSHRQGGMGSY